MPVQSSVTSFRNLDGLHLVGTFVVPDGPSDLAVVLVHGGGVMARARLQSRRTCAYAIFGQRRDPSTVKEAATSSQRMSGIRLGVSAATTSACLAWAAGHPNSSGGGGTGSVARAHARQDDSSAGRFAMRQTTTKGSPFDEHGSLSEVLTEHYCLAHPEALGVPSQ
jgi:hypothetical protein